MPMPAAVLALKTGHIAVRNGPFDHIKRAFRQSNAAKISNSLAHKALESKTTIQPKHKKSLQKKRARHQSVKQR